MCWKIPFESKASALESARKHKNKRQYKGLEINAFKCKQCGKWHLGNYRKELLFHNANIHKAQPDTE